jgi:hypothetical protein
MGGPIEPPPLSQPQRDANWTPIVLGVVVVVVLVGVVAWLQRSQPRRPVGPPPYAANLKFSDLKMSQAQNFVGASVTYLDGAVTNSGQQTVTGVLIHVVFQDSMGQVAQIEDVPLRVLQTGGPYLDAVDLGVSPLAPGQSKQFRLIFEHVSSEWNQAYPELQVKDVRLK